MKKKNTNPPQKLNTPDKVLFITYFNKMIKSTWHQKYMWDSDDW